MLPFFLTSANCWRLLHLLFPPQSSEGPLLPTSPWFLWLWINTPEVIKALHPATGLALSEARFLEYSRQLAPLILFTVEITGSGSGCYIVYIPLSGLWLNTCRILLPKYSPMLPLNLFYKAVFYRRNSNILLKTGSNSAKYQVSFHPLWCSFQSLLGLYCTPYWLVSGQHSVTPNTRVFTNMALPWVSHVSVSLLLKRRNVDSRN